MKNTIAILASLLLACGAAYADEAKPEAKKSEKAKAQAKKKSDKNVFQKTESSVGEWARRNKIWTRSEPRGTAEKK
jgi:transposase